MRCCPFRGRFSRSIWGTNFLSRLVVAWFVASSATLALRRGGRRERIATLGTREVSDIVRPLVPQRVAVSLLSTFVRVVA